MSFYYSLRYMLDPRKNTEEKNEKLYKFVKDAQIDNVAFFINGEELNHSHLTSDEVDTWLNAIKPVQKKLAEIGVSTSLNPWTTIMHSDRGYHVNPELGFRTFVDMNGHQAQDMACPADPKWQHYLATTYAHYASIHPKELWLEDDFRHYNHSPLKLMCFCDYHMKLYTERLGKAESREEFVKNMFKPGTPSPERQIYLDQARAEMIATAHQIEQAVHQVSRETNLALMTSFPNWHALEGRDWKTLFKTLAGEGHPIIARPHLPAYNEVSALQYGRDFETYTRITAAYLGDDAILYPELENYMYSPLVKSNEFIKLQIITTALVGAKGIFLNMFDMIGNGVNESWHYAKLLNELKPFLNQLTEHRLQMSKLAGIKILVDQDSSYSLQTKTGQDTDLLPHDQNWASLLSSFGFATTITPVKHNSNFNRQVLAISGQLLRNFTNAQITDMITNNYVLLDGESIQVLLDKHLNNLVHINNAEWHPYRTGYQSFEQADGYTVDGVTNPRITMLQHTGNYLQIQYNHGANVKIISSAYNSLSEKLGNVMALIDDHILIMPMDQDPKYVWESQFTTYKQGIYQQILPVDHIVAMPGVKLNREQNTIWLSSFILDSYDEIKIQLHEPINISQALVTYRTKNGYKSKLYPIKVDNSILTIDKKLHGLETIRIELQ